MKGLIYDERIGKMAAELAGVDGMRVWHDQALIKQAYGNPTGWHLDNPYWSFSSRDAISIWIALDDATLPVHTRRRHSTMQGSGRTSVSCLMFIRPGKR
jgi:hypothetical protein